MRTNQKQEQPALEERILRKQALHELTGLSESTIWRLEHAGYFPTRISLGMRAVGWRYSEVVKWLEERKYKA